MLKPNIRAGNANTGPYLREGVESEDPFETEGPPSDIFYPISTFLTFCTHFLPFLLCFWHPLRTLHI